MKAVIALITLFLFASIPTGLFAQTVEERLNALEKVLKEQEKTIKEQQKVIEDLKAEVKGLQPPVQGAAAAKEPAAAARASQTQQVQELKEKVDQVAEAQTRTVPSVFNPAIGLVGETVFSYRSKGSDETGSDRPGGFDAFQRSVELNLSASVDPFAKGYAVINASADPRTGESNATVEEAAIQTTSLPWNPDGQGRQVLRGIRPPVIYPRPRAALRQPSPRPRSSMSAANRGRTACRSTIWCPSPIT